MKDAYTLSLTYVGVVAHVRGRTAALVCRIPSLLPNGAGCSVVATVRSSRVLTTGAVARRSRCHVSLGVWQADPRKTVSYHI